MMRQVYRLTRETSCCFSGYRPEKLPWRTKEDDPRCQELKRKIKLELEQLYRSGMRHFFCGMARGSDMYFCEAALNLREEYTEITIEAAIPCEAQAARWNEWERSRYFHLVGQCDVETFVSREYTKDCMIRRNRYMVDNSAVLLAVYDGKFGGTMQTIEYAARKGLKVITIAP